MTRYLAAALLSAMIVLSFQSSAVEARGGYPSWVKHGDVYQVVGKFGGQRRTFKIQIRWRGNRFVVRTPLGSFKLRHRGRAISFKVNFQKSWAHVRWVRNRATVTYRKKRGIAVLRKVGNRAGRENVTRILK